MLQSSVLGHLASNLRLWKEDEREKKSTLNYIDNNMLKLLIQLKVQGY